MLRNARFGGDEARQRGLRRPQGPGRARAYDLELRAQEEPPKPKAKPKAKPAAKPKAVPKPKGAEERAAQGARRRRSAPRRRTTTSPRRSPSAAARPRPRRPRRRPAPLPPPPRRRRAGRRAAAVPWLVHMQNSRSRLRFSATQRLAQNCNAGDVGPHDCACVETRQTREGTTACRGDDHVCVCNTTWSRTTPRRPRSASRDYWLPGRSAWRRASRPGVCR